MFCNQCTTEFDRAPGTFEVWGAEWEADDAPMTFCSASCAGTFLTDCAVA